MVGVGRDLCGSPSPALLLKQGHLQQAAEDLVQVGLEYLQRRRLHNQRTTDKLKVYCLLTCPGRSYVFGCITVL